MKALEVGLLQVPQSSRGDRPIRPEKHRLEPGILCTIHLYLAEVLLPQPRPTQKKCPRCLCSWAKQAGAPVSGHILSTPAPTWDTENTPGALLPQLLGLPPPHPTLRQQNRKAGVDRYLPVVLLKTVVGGCYLSLTLRRAVMSQATHLQSPSLRRNPVLGQAARVA